MLGPIMEIAVDTAPNGQLHSRYTDTSLRIIILRVISPLARNRQQEMKHTSYLLHISEIGLWQCKVCAKESDDIQYIFNNLSVPISTIDIGLARVYWIIKWICNCELPIFGGVCAPANILAGIALLVYEFFTLAAAGFAHKMEALIHQQHQRAAAHNHFPFPGKLALALVGRSQRRRRSWIAVIPISIIHLWLMSTCWYGNTDDNGRH